MSKLEILTYIEITLDSGYDVEVTLYNDGDIAIRQEHSDEIVMPLEKLTDEIPRLQFLLDNHNQLRRRRDK